MTSDTDRLYERILVLRCQAGDESAFEELIVRYGGRLRYYVRKLLGALDGSDDVLQDVWLDVFRALPRLKEPAALSTWLYRVARDRVYRVLRKRRVVTRALDEAELTAPSEGDDETFSAEDVERIHAALDALRSEHREVLVLRFLEGMSYEGIGEVVGCKVGTVRSRLYYAKRALRRAMERNESHG